jgi:anti-sigma regulatory factor (Ser/Thr protein kinase)
MEKNMNPERDTVGLHTFMQDRRTVFCYSGPLTEDLLTTIANPVRHQLSDKETEEAVANRVFGVFVEQAQNIIRYSHQKTKSTGDSVGTIAISTTDDGFLIEAVNVVTETKRDVLEATLVDLSVKDQKELRKLYRQRLKDGPPEDSKGAGLGFIEMARRVKKFEFDFQAHESGAVFVYRGWVT